jgi:beta-lactamase class A
MRHTFMKKLTGVVSLFFWVFPFFLCGQSFETPQRIQRLRNRIAAITRGIEGEVGVAAKHIETGEEILINGDTYFPMASVFKVPILVEVMAQIKEGRFALEDEISIQKTDQHLGSGYLSGLDAPGIKLSIRNLINMMMMVSDNSAADILLTKVGPENVNARLRSYGLEKITVDRTCQHMIMDAIGMDFEKYKDLPLDAVSEGLRKDVEETPEVFEQARANFSKILKDQSSPRALNNLMEMIFTKTILDAESCDFIISVMLKCQTGERRLKGDLPRYIQVAHKTGTMEGTVNNAGIIYLPDDLGHVAITVFIKDMEGGTQKGEDVIAQIARFVFDYFCFTAELGNGQEDRASSG